MHYKYRATSTTSLQLITCSPKTFQEDKMRNKASASISEFNLEFDHEIPTSDQMRFLEVGNECVVTF